MPELPEVETIKRQLSTKLIGLTIKDIEVRKPKMFIGKKEEVIGKKILEISRRAKLLIIKLQEEKEEQEKKEKQETFLVFHLKLTGQLVYADKDGKTVVLGHPIPFAGTTLPAKTTHIIFYFRPSPKGEVRKDGRTAYERGGRPFSNGGRLFFNDLRQFGWVKVMNGEELKSLKQEFGIEPFTPDFTLEKFRDILANWGRPIKLLLMEQSKIAGIGNIYANDALFLAGIAPHKRARDLVKKEPEKVEELYKDIFEVLNKGIEAGGSSAADEAFVNINGEKGNYKFLVYQKEGQPCPNKCGGRIRRMELGGRGTFYCPKCQK